MDRFASYLSSTSYLFGDSIVLDDFFDRLNRGWMSHTMVAFAVVASIRINSGEAIVCHGFHIFDHDYNSDYCWSVGMYTVYEAYTYPRTSVPYPGIIPSDLPSCFPGWGLEDGGTIVCPPGSDAQVRRRVYHTWYQWVPLYFLMIFAVFALPYLIYSAVASNAMKGILKIVAIEKLDINAQRKAAIYLCTILLPVLRYQQGSKSKKAPKQEIRLNTMEALWQKYHLAIYIFLLKISYFIVAYASLELTDSMFYPLASFKTFGFDWFFPEKNGNFTAHVKDRAFPKVVACEIKRYGASGVEEENGMCVVAPMVLYQYLFLVYWFMLVFLIVLNFLSLVFSFARVLLPDLTYEIFRRDLCTFRDDSLYYTYMAVGPSGRILMRIVAENCRGAVAPDIFAELLYFLYKKGALPPIREQGNNGLLVRVIKRERMSQAAATQVHQLTPAYSQTPPMMQTQNSLSSGADIDSNVVDQPTSYGSSKKMDLMGSKKNESDPDYT